MCVFGQQLRQVIFFIINCSHEGSCPASTHAVRLETFLQLSLCQHGTAQVQPLTLLPCPFDTAGITLLPTLHPTLCRLSVVLRAGPG